MTAYIMPREPADQDPVAGLLAQAVSVADLFELLLEEGRFPAKGRSADDKEAYAAWLEDRHDAILRLRKKVQEVRAARNE